MNRLKVAGQRFLKGVSWITGASDQESPLRFGIGVPYLPVSQRDAQFNSAVMACVRWACTQISEPPIVVEKEKDDDWKVVPRHDAAALVRSPQDRLADRESKSGYNELMCGTVFSLMTDGNTYWLKLRKGRTVIGLEWVPSHLCEPVWKPGAPNLLDKYRVQSGGASWREVPAADIVHVQDGTPDPYNPLKSLSPLKSVMRLLMSDNQIAVYLYGILRHPIPSVLLSPKDKKIDPDQEMVDGLLRSLYKRSGGENAGGIAVPNVPMDATTLGYKPDEMAVDKLPKIGEERITAIFGIPAIVVGLGAGLQRSTFANVNAARDMAAENFLKPTWAKIASALTTQLLPDFDRSEGVRFAFDLREVGILQEDEDALHKRVREDFAANLIDRATALTRLGMKPDPATDEGVYAFMLSVPRLPFDAGKMAGAAKARAEAERIVQ